MVLGSGGPVRAKRAKECGAPVQQSGRVVFLVLRGRAHAQHPRVSARRGGTLAGSAALCQCGVPSQSRPPRVDAQPTPRRFFADA